jgi:hypothetical protein
MAELNWNNFVTKGEVNDFLRFPSPIFDFVFIGRRCGGISVES